MELIYTHRMSGTFGSECFNLVVYLAPTAKLKSLPILLFYLKGTENHLCILLFTYVYLVILCTKQHF